MKLVAMIAAPMLISCGGTTPATPDAIEASSPDARATDVDAAEPPPVTVEDVGVRETVLFYDADGALLARVTPTAFGPVRGQVPAGGSVTVVDGTPATFMTTFLEVAPGDNLHVGLSSPTPPSTTSYDIIVPNDGTDAQYHVLGAHLKGDAVAIDGGPVTIHASLDDNAPHTATALVLQAQHTASTRTFVLGDWTLTSAPLDLSSFAWNDGSRQSFVLTHGGIPVAATATYSLVDDGVAFAPVAGKTNNGEVDLTVPVRGAPTMLNLDIAGATLFHERVTIRDLSQNIDLQQFDLPELTSPAVSADGVVTWTSTGGVLEPVAAQVVLEMGAGNLWAFIAPGTKQSFRLPQLPSDLAWAASPTGISGVFVGSNDAGGYATYRNDPFAVSPHDYAYELPHSPGGYRVAHGF